MANKKDEQRFAELTEHLSNREWPARDGIVALEDMSASHIKRVIGVIEDGGINLLGQEEEFIAMFKEELEDRTEELNFGED